MFKRTSYTAVVLLVGIVLGSVLQPFKALESLAQPGCVVFKETSKTLCGQFLTYWNTHGALAQQGYPISGEFAEVSPLNGQTYTVQYFERAVFEKHPENKPPFDVLLSQLGTFQFKAKYPNGESDPRVPIGTPVPGIQTFTGHGAQTTDLFPLKAGLARFHMVGTNGNGNFAVWLLDSAGNRVDLLANALGAADTTKALNIAKAGGFILQVEHWDGNWTVTVQQ